jgi:hypothetical protein
MSGLKKNVDIPKSRALGLFLKSPRRLATRSRSLLVSRPW